MPATSSHSRATEGQGRAEHWLLWRQDLRCPRFFVCQPDQPQARRLALRRQQRQPTRACPSTDASSLELQAGVDHAAIAGPAIQHWLPEPLFLPGEDIERVSVAVDVAREKLEIASGCIGGWPS